MATLQNHIQLASVGRCGLETLTVTQLEYDCIVGIKLGVLERLVHVFEPGPQVTVTREMLTPGHACCRTAHIIQSVVSTQVLWQYRVTGCRIRIKRILVELCCSLCV